MRSVLGKQNVQAKKVYFNRHYQNLKSIYHGSGKWHIKYKYSEGYSRIHPWSVIEKENCLKARELISRFYHTFHGYWNKNAQSSLHKHGYTLWFSIIFLHIIELTLTKLHVYWEALAILQLSLNVLYLKSCEIQSNRCAQVESMYSSYSPFDCISWNRLIAYYSFTGPLPRKMSQDRYVSLWTFQSIFFSVCRCCLFVCFISQTRETFWISELRWFVT